MLCYFPQWIWNIWEGGLAKTLVMGMNHSMQPAEEIKKKKSTLMRYLMTHIRVIIIDNNFNTLILIYTQKITIT